MRNDNDFEALTKELQQIILRQEQILSILQGRAAPTEFEVGDKVYVKNRIDKPKTWRNDAHWNEAEARTATVTKVVQAHGQVHFITKNGVETWRAPGNLQLLQKHE